MKKLIYLLSIILLFSACSKNTHSPEIVGKADKNSNNVEEKIPENTNSTNKPEVKLPTHTMGQRCIVKWKVDENQYLEDFYIEDIQAGKISKAQIEKYFIFYSTDVDGSKYHEFTEEEIKDVELTDIHYDGEYIRLKAKYKGITSLYKSSLSFNKTKYYERRVKINPDFAAKYYLRGVYENLSLFMDEMLEYDKDKYQLDDIRNKYMDESANGLTFNIVLISKTGNKYLAEISKTVSGFKPLSNLGTELTLTATTDFNELVRAKIARTKGIEEGVNFAEKLQASMINEKWMIHTEPRVNGVEMSWRSDYSNNYLITGSGLHLDVYLYKPYFEVTSAIIKDGNLDLKVKLNQVNDVSLDNVILDFKVKNIKFNPKSKE